MRGTVKASIISALLTGTALPVAAQAGKIAHQLVNGVQYRAGKIAVQHNQFYHMFGFKATAVGFQVELVPGNRHQQVFPVGDRVQYNIFQHVVKSDTGVFTFHKW